MTDWNPLVVKIQKIEKHQDANNLSIATVMGDYPVCIKTGQYEVDQLVGYLNIDTIVPDTAEFYFLCPKKYDKYEEDGELKQRSIGPKYLLGEVPEKYRCIKAKKFLGQYSQGMLIDCPVGLKEGDSLVEVLGLKKWEEEEEDNLPGVKKSLGANAEKAPQGWSIPYYDIEGIRKYLNCLEEDEEVVLTEKIHGSHADFCYDGQKLWVKSRNYYKKFDPEDMWHDLAIRYDLENKLKNVPNMVLFGECYGQVKGFRYDTELTTKVRFFDVFDVTKRRYLDYDDRVKMINDLGLDSVPELYRGKWMGKEKMYQYGEGMTLLGGKHIREGFVLNTVKERFEPRLNSRMQLKFISEAYCLKK